MEEHRNCITNPAFREGILEALGYKVDDLPLDEKDAIIKDVEENWWFCGGRDTKPDCETQCPYDEGAWRRLWRHYFGEKPMPDARQFCVCLQDGLRYNLYITDGVRVIIIGSVCVNQFLPRIASQVKETKKKKQCDRCMKPHKNRKDNYCKPCRILNKKDDERRIKEEYEQSLRIQAERQAIIAREREAEHKRLVEIRRQEEERRLRICQCGCGKLPQYPLCYACSERKKKEDIAKMTDQQKKAFLCECGAKKKPQFPTCWSCRGQ